jgi:hypothetical protein
MIPSRDWVETIAVGEILHEPVDFLSARMDVREDDSAWLVVGKIRHDLLEDHESGQAAGGCYVGLDVPVGRLSKRRAKMLENVCRRNRQSREFSREVEAFHVVAPGGEVGPKAKLVKLLTAPDGEKRYSV